MSAVEPRSRPSGKDLARGGGRSPWVWRVSRERERRLYFLATLGLLAWYLVSRLL